MTQSQLLRMRERRGETWGRGDEPDSPLGVGRNVGHEVRKKNLFVVSVVLEEHDRGRVGEGGHADGIELAVLPVPR